MKIISLVSSVCLLLLLMVACASEGETIDQSTAAISAKGFMQALQEKKFDTARKYCTEPAAKSIFDLETTYKMSNPEEVAELNSKYDFRVAKVDCSEQAGNTICKVCCHAEGAEAELQLVQQDQKWLVSTELGM